jgi:RimJ/RimL family protein N-acetyltransferase
MPMWAARRRVRGRGRWLTIFGHAAVYGQASTRLRFAKSSQSHGSTHVSPAARHLAAMWADPTVTRHIGEKPFGVEESWTRLLRYAGPWMLLGFGYWVIEEKATGRFAGEIGFSGVPHSSGEPALDARLRKMRVPRISSHDVPGTTHYHFCSLVFFVVPFFVWP